MMKRLANVLGILALGLFASTASAQQGQATVEIESISWGNPVNGQVNDGGFAIPKSAAGNAITVSGSYGPAATAALSSFGLHWTNAPSGTNPVNITTITTFANGKWTGTIPASWVMANSIISIGITVQNGDSSASDTATLTVGN